MKKIQGGGYGTIAFDEIFLCAAGGSLRVWERNTFAPYAVFRDMKNIGYLHLRNGALYAKTTTGVYGAYDLEKKNLLYKTTCREKANTSHDGDFAVSADMVLADVLQFKGGSRYFVKTDLRAATYIKLLLTDSDYSRTALRWQPEENSVSIVCTQINCMAYPQTNCRLFAIDIDHMCITRAFSFTLEHGTYPLAFLDNDTLLLNTMKTFSLSNGKQTTLDKHNRFQECENGYLTRIAPLGGGKVAVVFSEKTFIYDQTTGELLYSTNCKYANSIAYIDGNLLFGTWDGLFLDHVRL